MNITVNGDPMTVGEAFTVARLLDRLALNAPGTALALNASVLPRGQWEQHALHEGDDVVIFQAIAGG